MSSIAKDNSEKMAVFLLYMTAVISFAYAEAKTPCAIVSSGHDVNVSCTGLNLTSVPDYLPNDITQLNFSHNRLSHITKSTFARFQRLRILDLSFNTISRLDVNIFACLGEMQELHLAHNNMSVLKCNDSPGTEHVARNQQDGMRRFQTTGANQPYFRTLHSLYLDDNNLEEVCFTGMNSLKMLSLSLNALITVPNGTFKDNVNLETLDLEQNNLQRLQPGSFTGLSQLRTLRLLRNRLQYTTESLPPGLFAPMNNTLTLLHLQGNDIGESYDERYPESTFMDLSALEYLKMDAFPKPTFGSGFAAMHRLLSLDLSHDCQLRVLTNTTFLGLTNTSLQTLVMRECRNLMHMEICVFCPLRHLAMLDIENIGSRFMDLQRDLRIFYGLQGRNTSLLVNLDTFARHSARGVSLNRKSMKFALNTCISHFIVRHNSIVSIGRDGLGVRGSRFSECLQSLDLSFNMIYTVDPFALFELVGYSPRLESLEWQRQRVYDLDTAIYSFRNKKSPEKHFFPLPGLKAKLNSVLSFVNISGALRMMSDLPRHLEITDAENLKTLDLSYLRMYNCITQLKGLEHLETLILSGNNCRNTSYTFFSSFPRLKYLELQKMNFDPSFFSTQRSSELFVNTTHLEVLDLSDNKLEKLSPHLLHAQGQLDQLFLAGNMLTNLSLDISRHENLTLLDLSDNKISQLDGQERSALDALVARQSHALQIRLHGNPLACTCDTLSFVRWLRSTRARMDHGGDYLCITDSGQLSTTALVADHWERAWRRCVGPTALWSAVATLFVLLSAVGVAWGVALNVTRLRFLVQVFRNIRMPRRTEFQKDVYVAYCDADTEFACTRVKTALQDERGVGLLIKDLPRNLDGEPQYWLIPGENRVDKMYAHIDMCWKVLLLLTPDTTRGLDLDPDRDLDLDRHRDDLERGRNRDRGRGHGSEVGWLTRGVLQSISDRMPDRVILLCAGVRRLPALPPLRALLKAVPEKQILFLPPGAGDDHPVWDRLAQIVFAE